MYLHVSALKRRLAFFCLLGLHLLPSIAQGDTPIKTKGYVGLLSHYYPRDGVGQQEHGDYAVVGELESSLNLTPNYKVKIRPYFRYDPHNSERNSTQLKEFEIEYRNDEHYVDLGQRILSWSTTESVNVLPLIMADIINRRDYNADPDGQQKLGRPMLSYGHLGESVLVQVIYLPYFISDKFGDITGRETFTQGLYYIDKEPRFSHDRDEKEASGALRVEVQSDSTNYAAYLYQGFANTNHFKPVAPTRLAPEYVYQRVYGFTSQSTTEDWLIKSELVYHQNIDDIPTYKKNYFNGILGVEYAVLVYGSGADIALFAEYIYDQRRQGVDSATFSNDFFAGIRWAPKDKQSSVFTAGLVTDVDNASTVVHLNYTQRVGEKYAIDMTLRDYFPRADSQLNALKNDSLFKLTFKYHF